MVACWPSNASDTHKLSPKYRPGCPLGLPARELQYLGRAGRASEPQRTADNFLVGGPLRPFHPTNRRRNTMPGLLNAEPAIRRSVTRTRGQRCAARSGQGNHFEERRTSEGQLNAFQKVMLQWSSLHPYNATHTVQDCGIAARGPVREAARDTNLAHGLGVVHLSPDGQSTIATSGTTARVAVLAAGAEAGATARRST